MRRPLTDSEREDIRELLSVAYTTIRGLADDALHTRISPQHRRNLESLADKAQALRDRLE